MRKLLNDAKKSAIMTMAALKRAFLKMDMRTRGGVPPARLSSRICHRTNATIMRSETINKTEIHGVDQPTTLPSVKANISAMRPHVIRVPPIQSTAHARPWVWMPLLSLGISTRPATETVAASILHAPNTQRQLAYSEMTPERKLPQMLPRGPPAAISLE